VMGQETEGPGGNLSLARNEQDQLWWRWHPMVLSLSQTLAGAHNLRGDRPVLWYMKQATHAQGQSVLGPKLNPQCQ